MIILLFDGSRLPSEKYAYDCQVAVEHLFRLRTVCFHTFRFTALEDEVGWLILGIIVSILISMLSVILPAIKNKIIKKIFQGGKKDSLLVRDSEDETE